MRRMRKQIHRLHRPQFISILQKFSEIAGECCRITTDVDDFFRSVVQHGLSRLRVESRAWRIDDNDIKRVLATGFQLITEHLFGSALIKTDIADLVTTTAPERILDRGGMRLDTDDTFAEPREVLADRAHPTVGIEDGIALTEVGRLGDRTVELLGTKRIRLEEGKG